MWRLLQQQQQLGEVEEEPEGTVCLTETEGALLGSRRRARRCPPVSPPPPLPPQAAEKSPKAAPAGGKARPLLAALRSAVSPVLLEAFTLTFLAEWGDRSQIATIGETFGACLLADGLG